METKYYMIFLALLLSFVFSNKALAQRCLVFRYDTDGNRISRTVTTNCNGVRDIADEQENVASDEEVKVYPNPNNGSFKVVVPESIKHDNSCYELYDINSVLISSGSIREFETDIDIGDHPAGVYLVKITNGYDVITEIVLKQ